VFVCGLRHLGAGRIVIDSHCHLADEKFRGDLPQVIARAKAAGVLGALVILEGGNAAEAEQAGQVEQLWPEARTAIGVHPHIAHQYAADPERAATVVRAALDRTPSARAVGEIGLDYHYDLSPREVQERVFRAQLRLARERELPVVIHTREAEDDTIAILREEGGGTLRGVLHCFTGGPSLARRAIDLGFYVSLAGIVTFPKAIELRETARLVPLDRLLTETDSPFLAPVPHRGQRNEPALVAAVVAALAVDRGIPAADLAAHTTANYRALFAP
jgi:TatD DNase family protein